MMSNPIFLAFSFIFMTPGIMYASTIFKTKKPEYITIFSITFLTWIIQNNLQVTYPHLFKNKTDIFSFIPAIPMYSFITNVFIDTIVISITLSGCLLMAGIEINPLRTFKQQDVGYQTSYKAGISIYVISIIIWFVATIPAWI